MRIHSWVQDSKTENFYSELQSAALLTPLLFNLWLFEKSTIMLGEYMVVTLHMNFSG